MSLDNILLISEFIFYSVKNASTNFFLLEIVQRIKNAENKKYFKSFL
jgi:hypothetical protein